MNTNRNDYDVDQLLRSALTSREKADPALVQRVKNEYVNKNYMSRKTRGGRSSLRIGIVVICLLVLTTSVAVATNFFGLRSQVVPEEAKPNDIVLTDGTKIPINDIISLQGYIGSPEYEAFVEWSAFTASYDPDHAILNQVGNDLTVVDQMYALYGCYTQEMVDKLHEIADKYGLILHGKFTGFDPSVDPSALDNFMNTVAEGNFFDIEHTGFSGYTYEDGTFKFEYALPGVDESNLPPYEPEIWIRPFEAEGREALSPELIDEIWGKESAKEADGKTIVWVPISRDSAEFFIAEDAFIMDYSSGEFVARPYDGKYDLNEVWKSYEDWQLRTNSLRFGNGLSLRYNVKGSLDYVGIHIKDINEFSEWEYKTAHGFTVSLAYSDNGSLIFANLDKAFVTVSFMGGSDFLSPSELEAYADKIDFSKIK